MTDTLFLSSMCVQFLQSVEWACLTSFAQFFKGVSPGVTTWSNSLVDQLEACLIFLQATQIDMAYWETSSFSLVTVDWVDSNIAQCRLPRRHPQALRNSGPQYIITERWNYTMRLNGCLVVRGWYGQQSFNKMTKCVNKWLHTCMTSWTHTQHDSTIRRLKTVRQHMLSVTDRW